ncbi:MAG TPA: hypothetical protein VGD62_04960 [Acidobacteriaceae bacterium]
MRARPVALTLLALSLGLAAPLAPAQGCTACRDATAGSAPRARQGLRRGIAVLGSACAGVLVAICVVAGKIERSREP